MRRIACIHTVYSVIDSFTAHLRQSIPGEFLIHTLYDDFLATDPAPAQSGTFTPINHQRLRLDMQTQALTGADLIVVTCSTLSPSVRQLRGEFNIPIIAIDDAMMKEAVARGNKIGLLATATSTVSPSTSALYAAAREFGKAIEVQAACDENAIQALKSGDSTTHDRIVLELAKSLKDVDVIVLAQASMAHMEQPVAQETGVLTLSSPSRCIAQVRELLS